MVEADEGDAYPSTAPRPSAHGLRVRRVGRHPRAAGRRRLHGGPSRSWTHAGAARRQGPASPEHRNGSRSISRATARQAHVLPEGTQPPSASPRRSTASCAASAAAPPRVIRMCARPPVAQTRRAGSGVVACLTVSREGGGRMMCEAPMDQRDKGCRVGETTHTWKCTRYGTQAVPLVWTVCTVGTPGDGDWCRQKPPRGNRGPPHARGPPAPREY